MPFPVFQLPLVAAKMSGTLPAADLIRKHKDLPGGNFQPILSGPKGQNLVQIKSLILQTGVRVETAPLSDQIKCQQTGHSQITKYGARPMKFRHTKIPFRFAPLTSNEKQKTAARCVWTGPAKFLASTCQSAAAAQLSDCSGKNTADQRFSSSSFSRLCQAF